ncbi:hypothetical protein A7K91_04655 [Paenibacillus oryzae]|uniref:Uncharacterized protein n=1 Tax=Paenibacillus oryzae TaxID=1844972 RepID=A0A1A5YGU8_9BACL|nr:hypothetical protein [Paenibacillus oryzae]OBR64876.1 hypothetical protein A7K91_04655 [Paenibacillus oryzae]
MDSSFGLGILVYALAIGGVALFLWLLLFIIRSAIDQSKTSAKLDELIVEIQILRKELKEIKGRGGTIA